MSRILTASFLVIVLATPAHADITVQQMVRGMVENAIQPGYAAASSTAVRLGESIAKLCASPSQDALDDARLHFASAAGAWSQMETIRFGPVTQQNRQERLLYWPDRRSIGLKQVQAILADKDQTALTLESLSAKSVAVQGFGALEFVLYGTGSEDLLSSGGAFRCAYGRAIAENIHANAESVFKGWSDPTGIAGQWEHPSAENPLYRTADESIAEIVDTVLQGLEMVRDVRLRGFLADKAEDDKPKQALYWRSGQTLASIAENLKGLKLIVEHSGLRERLPHEESWIIDSILFEFNNANQALFPLLDDPIAEVLADPKRRATLDYVRLVTSGLTESVGKQLTEQLGITSGFSSLDGD